MARDYKNAGRGRPAPQTPGWVWLLVGLLMGLAVALAVYLGGFTVSELRNSRATPVQIEASPDARSASKPPQSQPLPEAPPTAKPRFDFYTILPEMEVAVPEQETAAKPAQGEGAAPVDKPGAYILQAGSFRSLEEADKLKASLVLLGVEASIQTVTVNNKDTWHRVQVGPYNDLAEVNQVRARLKQNNIEVVLLKVKS
ncbi:MAG TPA: SPOR domain-containing protein [Gammaproteobacteria bacterium]|nr:SPOR domain-containing protein [Gammaproteobacteria bacterium]